MSFFVTDLKIIALKILRILKPHGVQMQFTYLTAQHTMQKQLLKQWGRTQLLFHGIMTI